MPVVPSSNGPTIGTAPLPQLRSSTDDFAGGPRPPDLSGMADSFSRIAEDEREKANQIAVIGAGGQARQAQSSLLFDPQHGALNTHGQNAFAMPDQVNDAWQQQTAAIEGGLSNDDQKIAFRRMAQGMGDEINARVQDHVANERRQYDADVTNASIGAEQTSAIQNYDRPDMIAQNVANVTALIQSNAARTGQPAVLTQQQVAQRVTQIHTGVIDRMLANEDDLGAKAYRDAHADQITGDVNVQLDRALEEGSSRAASQRAADDILAGRMAPGMVSAGNIDLTNRPRVQNADGSVSTVRSISIEDNGKAVLIPTVSDDGRILSNADAIALYQKTGKSLGVFKDEASATAYAAKLHDAQSAMIAGTGTGAPTSVPTLSDAVALARGLADPRVRDLTEQRVRQTFAERKNDEREQAEQSMVQAGNLIDQDPGHRGQSSIPPAMWASFTPAQKSSLQSYADQKQAGPAKQTTNWQQWVDLRDMAANPATRQAFLNLDPMSYRSKLADAQFSEIVGLREGLQNADDKTSAKLDDLNVRHGIVTQSLHGIGVDIDPKKKQTDSPMTAEVYRDVDTQVEALQEQAKRKATDKEVQQITDEILTNRVVADPHWYNRSSTKTVRTFQLQPTDSLVLSPKDIAKPDRDAITAQLRARGLPITDDAIVKAYSDYVKGLVNRGPR